MANFGTNSSPRSRPTGGSTRARRSRPKSSPRALERRGRRQVGNICGPSFIGQTLTELCGARTRACPPGAIPERCSRRPPRVQQRRAGAPDRGPDRPIGRRLGGQQLDQARPRPPAERAGRVRWSGHAGQDAADRAAATAMTWLARRSRRTQSDERHLGRAHLSAVVDPLGLGRGAGVKSTSLLPEA